MDRLLSLKTPPHGLIALTLLLVPACEQKPSEPVPPPARYQAVTKQAAQQGVSDEELDGFCDSRESRKFRYPEISDGAELPKGRARWVNVWATWCKSCVEEMPLIEGWKSELDADVVFISADEEPEALSAFTKKHPSLPESARMKAPERLGDWMASLSLEEGSGLPLHLFVSKRGKIRCARTGAISKQHLSVVKHLLR